MFPPEVTLALSIALVVLLAIIGYRFWKASRISPEERERKRRAQLAAHGKMGDANLLEIRDGVLLYGYIVRGVQYTASQDISRLTSYIPTDLSSLGPVAVKYEPRNPANSIVLSEEWSGLRVMRGSVSEPRP